jgi:hypothetical protein
MTITATPPRRTREQLLAEARQHVGASIPSAESLRQALRVRRETAAEIRDALSRERAERRAERARQGRQALAAVARRKRPRPRPSLVIAPLPELTGPPAVEPPLPAAVAVTETVRDEVAAPIAEPVTASPVAAHRIRTWPILFVAAMAFVAIWGGWVGLGKLAGFGPVNLLPGIAPENGWATVDTAITLPMGMEAYSAYAFYVWLHRATPLRARRFALWSSLGAVALGMGGQTAYHLMTAAGMTAAPWQITTVVSCLPVAVFGLAAALVHMVRAGDER